MWTPEQKVRVPLVYCVASHILGFAPSSYVYKMLWLMLSQAQRSCFRGLSRVVAGGGGCQPARDLGDYSCRVSSTKLKPGILLIT